MSIFFRTLAGLLLISTPLFAGDKPPLPKTYQQPVLLTSAGQAADVLILKGLCMRAGIAIKYRPLATGDSLADMKALVLVTGGSSKGLGAAKGDASVEQDRVKKLIKTAQKAKLPILVFHIGGDARRGALSDPFNKLAGEAGEVVVVVKGGDDDGFFTKIVEKSKARFIPLENQAAAVPRLKELFPKPQAKTDSKGESDVKSK